MKKLILLLLIIAIFATQIPDGFIEIDRDCINPHGEVEDYVRYINSIRCDVDPYGDYIAIIVDIDSLEIDGIAIIQDSVTVYADTSIMHKLGWTRE